MAKLSLISGQTAIKIFSKIGYQVARKRGSHFRLRHSDKRPLSIPDHKILGKGLLRKLYLSSVCFLKLLNLFAETQKTFDIYNLRI